MKDPIVSRKKPNPTAETLRELEATGDRIADWASENAVLILGTIAGILVLAAAIGLWVQHSSSERDAAADALALATSEFRQAMGADPLGGPIPEPANPELGERTRSEYVERFVRVAEAHPGTAAGALAWLETGGLQVELGRLDEASRSFESARDAARDSSIGALAWTRIAGLAERRGDHLAAAQAYEAAAAISAFPLRAGALASAARCWDLADRPDEALSAFQRLETEFPDEAIAPDVEARMAELRLSAGR
jgi:predicted negative regulator of RcsB-dependent stress response